MHNTRVIDNMWEGLEDQTVSDWLSNSDMTARSSSISLRRRLTSLCGRCCQERAWPEGGVVRAR